MKPNFKPLHLTIIILLLFTACTKKQPNDSPINKKLLSDGDGLNGATIIVKNLDNARNYFADTLGFSMPPAERFENGMHENTRTASIFFADFSTFDLMATIDSVSKVTKKPFEYAFLKQNKSAGLYSFSSSSVDSSAKWLKSQGFKTGKVQVGRSAKQIAKGWDWDDGGPQWRSVAFESKDKKTHLPNFIE